MNELCLPYFWCKCRTFYSEQFLSIIYSWSKLLFDVQTFSRLLYLLAKIDQASPLWGYPLKHFLNLMLEKAILSFQISNNLSLPGHIKPFFLNGMKNAWYFPWDDQALSILPLKSSTVTIAIQCFVLCSTQRVCERSNMCSWLLVVCNVLVQ